MTSNIRTLVKRSLPRSIVAALRGRACGMRFLVNADFRDRWQILGRFQEISDQLVCEQSEPEAILVATRLLALSGDLNGDIVECGCYQGGSTAKLSVIAKKIGRKVVVFDSFMGLPEGAEIYRNIQTGEQVTFRQGDYAAGLEQVQKNVSEYGEPSMVDYIPGFFRDTMPGWKGRAAAIVLDVDLVESTKVCLQYLWPRLSPKGILFSQDCHLAEVCNLLSNGEFWFGMNEMNSPKFVGLGRAKMVYTYKTL